jgi:hypothetical protein
MSDRHLTPQDIADRYAVPIKTVYTWRYRGDGPPGFRCGKHLRFRLVDVVRWEQQRVDIGTKLG